MASRPPQITPVGVAGPVGSGEPGPAGTQGPAVPFVPAQVGDTFRAYTTALGQSLPAGITRARAAVKAFPQAVR